LRRLNPVQKEKLPIPPAPVRPDHTELVHHALG
jgi:hypothetical protein